MSVRVEDKETVSHIVCPHCRKSFWGVMKKELSDYKTYEKKVKGKTYIYFPTSGGYVGIPKRKVREKK